VTAFLVGYALIFAGSAGIVFAFWRATVDQSRMEGDARDATSSPHAPTVNRDRT